MDNQFRRKYFLASCVSFFDYPKCRLSRLYGPNFVSGVCGVLLQVLTHNKISGGIVDDREVCEMKGQKLSDRLHRLSHDPE